MPLGNPLGYLKKAGTFVKGQAGAARGKMNAANVAKFKQSSTARMSSMANSRVAKAVMNNKGKTALGVGAGYGAFNSISNRRGRGVDRMGRGRPTGIYKY